MHRCRTAVRFQGAVTPCPPPMPGDPTQSVLGGADSLGARLTTGLDPSIQQASGQPHGGLGCIRAGEVPRGDPGWTGGVVIDGGGARGR